MFSAYERHQRLTAEFHVRVMEERIQDLARVLADGFDTLWASAVDAEGWGFDAARDLLESDIRARIEAPLPRAPFKSPAAIKYRPVAGEAEGRQAAQQRLARTQRVMDKLATYGRTLATWIHGQASKPNPAGMKQALRAHLNAEIARLASPFAVERTPTGRITSHACAMR